MDKIPVGKTIAHAYGFTFGHFLRILGIVWAPFALMGVAGYFVLPGYIAAFRPLEGGKPDLQALGAMSGYFSLFFVVMFLCATMIYVGIARQALGLRKGPVFFYFSMDWVFWRLLGTLVLATLIFVVVGLLLGVVGGFAGAAVAAAGGAIGGAVGGFILVVVGLSAFLYVGFRMFFLMVPVTVAEKNRALRRSWSLSHGNFWRIFGILLAILVPYLVAQLVLEGVVMASVTVSVPRPAAGANPEAVAAYGAAILHAVVGMLPWLAPMALLLYTVMIGLMTSAQAFAYRALVPADVSAEFA